MFKPGQKGASPAQGAEQKVRAAKAAVLRKGAQKPAPKPQYEEESSAPRPMPKGFK